VLVGIPVAGRNRRELEGLIGCFVNTLVMRADLGGDPAFGELLARVRATALDAYGHQDLPFERIVEELVPERDLSHPPLFQALMVLQNTPRQELELPGLTLAPLAVENRVARVDLTLSFQEDAGGFAAALEHNSDLFDPATAARLLARFEALLAAAAGDPSKSLAELPALLPAERHQALVEWNDTARSYVTGVTLHELVARQAARTPDAVAVSFEGEALTYRELDRRANRLAHRLVASGVRPDGRVGVLMERSLEMIVALLGVLKAGAGYVPLDPTYPAERLAALVEGSGAWAVIAQGRLTHLLPGYAGRTVLLDQGWDGAGEPDEAPEIAVDEANLAYALFTSGSTGTPKGVMIPHRGIVNRLLWMQEAYGLTPQDRVLQKTPFSFDVSLWEFFWPLLVGARLVFARSEGHRDPAYLADLIAREGITTLHFVPSMLQVFLESQETFHLPSLRRVMASGEALPPELARRFYSRIAGAELHNLYGPTEASVDVSFWPCDPDPARGVVPIGRPIANLRLHVVDPGLRLQPIGVAGELLLGGVGLARGYMGRPDLTAAAFVPDPFGEAPGGRLYRTGDLVRTLPDGNVEFLGRIDHQVKIRGFRIELGEIEAVLASHPGVRECVVVAREDVPGSRYLAAYLAGDAKPDDLRAHLARRLPDYMVPSVFVGLEALPLSPNGKVDRKALPAPTLARREEEIVAPRTPTEEALAAIWKELLNLERVGVEDRFFELGGHSLLATQVLARVKQAFGVEISLHEVFRTPTIAGLAALVDERAVQPTDDDELAALLDELELLSDEEAKERVEDLRGG
jgi:amino acid adenylation domain-containing protein